MAAATWAAVRDSECLREERSAAGQQDMHEDRVQLESVPPQFGNSLLDVQLEWLRCELWVAKAEIRGLAGSNRLVLRGLLVKAKPEIVSPSTWETGAALSN